VQTLIIQRSCLTEWHPTTDPAGWRGFRVG
jgi:hypothetical protein